MSEISLDLPPYIGSCPASCRASYCHVVRMRCIYGLYDPRRQDIFYVGVAFDVQQRFREHLGRHEYVMRMLERGLFPLLIVLCEFSTRCDKHARIIEQDIREQLRQMGHSAYGDDTKSANCFFPWFYRMVEEQAYQDTWLGEVYRAGR